MENVIHVDFGGTERLLTKTELSRHPEIRRSRRWIEQRVAEGMPSTFDGYRRMFRLEDVLAWLSQNRPVGAAKGSGPAKGSSEQPTAAADTADQAESDSGEAPAPVIA